MNLTDRRFETHPLFIAYQTARNARDLAISNQWAAYDAGGLAAFKSAHDAAKLVCRTALEAEQACYDAGIAHAPYWHVTPKQLDGYERANKAIANRTPAEKAEALHPYR